MDRALRDRLLAVVTIVAPGTLPACGPRVVVSDASGDEGGEGITESTVGDGATSASATGTGGDTPILDLGGADEGDTPKFDIGSPLDSGIELDPRQCVQWRPDTEYACSEPPAYGMAGYQCAPLPTSGTCLDFDPATLQEAVNTCFAPECFGWYAWEVLCGPDPGVPDACCYWLLVEEGQLCPGRPFVVDGADRLAPLVAGHDWAAPAPAAPPRPRATREAIAAAYAQAGAFEHASVASFARFSLALLAVGAPAELVAAAAEATREEIDHARLWFGLAAREGLMVDPGPLDVAGALDEGVSLRTAVIAAIREGCVAETISALGARAAARGVDDPVMRQRLERLADEEQRHCELAWAFVRWALNHDPSLRSVAAAQFARAAQFVPRGPDVPETVDPTALRHAGLLTRLQRRRLATDALDRIVRPVAAALLATPQSVSSAHEGEQRSRPGPTARSPTVGG